MNSGGNQNIANLLLLPLEAEQFEVLVAPNIVQNEKQSTTSTTDKPAHFVSRLQHHFALASFQLNAAFSGNIDKLGEVRLVLELELEAHGRQHVAILVVCEAVGTAISDIDPNNAGIVLLPYLLLGGHEGGNR